jgi:hypothetical protein
VAASLRYDTKDPYAVHVAFHTGDEEEVVWTFARQLLVDGLDHESGLGDVRVWPWQDRSGRAVALALSSPSGQALFEVQRDVLADFLLRTYVEVPLGLESEHVNIDAELALLLFDDRA